MKMQPFMVFVSVDLLSMNRNTMLCHFGAATPIYHRTENQNHQDICSADSGFIVTDS